MPYGCEVLETCLPCLLLPCSLTREEHSLLYATSATTTWEKFVLLGLTAGWALILGMPACLPTPYLLYLYLQNFGDGIDTWEGVFSGRRWDGLEQTGGAGCLPACWRWLVPACLWVGTLYLTFACADTLCPTCNLDTRRQVGYLPPSPCHCLAFPFFCTMTLPRMPCLPSATLATYALYPFTFVPW